MFPERSLKGRAVALLSRREHSRLELARKLKPHCEDDEVLSQLLDTLVKEGWLSDERFVQSVVHRRARTHGASRIANDLRQGGIAEHEVAAVRDTLRESEFDRAKIVWEKRFGGSRTQDVGEQLDPTVARLAYARQARFLAGRGFGPDVIYRVLGQSDEFDED